MNETARHPDAYRLRNVTSSEIDGIACECFFFEAGGPSTAELDVYAVGDEVLAADETCWGEWYDVDPASAYEVLRRHRGQG